MRNSEDSQAYFYLFILFICYIFLVLPVHNTKKITRMFQDESLEPIDFKSSWKRERSMRDGGVQTRELPTDDVGSQSIKRKDKEVQTDDSERNTEFMDEDPRKLASFLSDIEPVIMKLLAQNMRSHAFDGYDVSWEDETDTITCKHTLTYPVFNKELQVTGISWNSTGSVLAAAYGRLDHEDWCTHRSGLCTWNIDRRNLDPNKPDSTIDLPCCLMAIASHPKNPSWIAGGTFNGEVMVWDLSGQEESMIASSGIGDDSHREPVSKVSWVEDSDSKGKKYNLVSVSGDGKILVWQLNAHKQKLTLIDGFILLTESLPRSMKAKRGDGEMGVTCLSYSVNDPTTFLLGSESGGIFKCSTHTRGTPASRNIVSSVPLRSPVTFTFAPHHGPVYSVDNSPFHRNLFISCGTDTSARIYSVLQTEPLITLEPGLGYLYSAKWSPLRPLVFAVATEDGTLLIYDLKHNRGTPKYKLNRDDKKEPIFSMQFNSHQHLLATGDGAGNVNVWELNKELTHTGGREMDILDEIAGHALE